MNAYEDKIIQQFDNKEMLKQDLIHPSPLNSLIVMSTGILMAQDIQRSVCGMKRHENHTKQTPGHTSPRHVAPTRRPDTSPRHVGGVLECSWMQGPRAEYKWILFYYADNDDSRFITAIHISLPCI